MSGNSIGKLLTLTTFGESHGVAIGGILDGCPPNLVLDEEFIQSEVERRKTGSSRFVSPRNEEDKVEFLSGIFEGKTTGTPISFIIKNKDQRSKDYSDIKDKFRPSHADYSYFKKYGIRDYRGGGRSSARETVARVVGGAIAKLILKKLANIEIYSYLSQIGEHKLDFVSLEEVKNNPFCCPNSHQVETLERYLADIRREGDSVGAEITLITKNVPAGLGEPVFERLDAMLAMAVMSINAVKGVEIGDGFDCVNKKGSQFRDEMTKEDGFLSNHAGGILGGISSGQDIIVKAAFKPTSSILKEGRTIYTNGENTSIITKGRHDPCVALRACPIMEAMVALVLADYYLIDKRIER